METTLAPAMSETVETGKSNDGSRSEVFGASNFERRFPHEPAKQL